MRREVVRSPDAIRDLIDAFDFLNRKSPQSARRFLRAVGQTFTLLADRPGVGQRHDAEDPALADVRVSPVTRFRSYLVVYRAIGDRLEVIRVLHASRDIEGILSGPPDGP